jgi:hypothetical protein
LFPSPSRIPHRPKLKQPANLFQFPLISFNCFLQNVLQGISHSVKSDLEKHPRRLVGTIK